MILKKHVLLLMFINIFFVVFSQSNYKANTLNFHPFVSATYDSDTLEIEFLLEVVNMDSIPYIYYYFYPSEKISENFIFKDYSFWYFLSNNNKISLSYLELKGGKIDSYVLNPKKEMLIKLKFRIYFQCKIYQSKRIDILNSFYNINNIPIEKVENLFYAHKNFLKSIDYEFSVLIKRKRNNKISIIYD